MRRILAFTLSVVMVLAFAAVAFAGSSPVVLPDSGSSSSTTTPEEGTTTKTELSDGTVVETTKEADGSVTTETTTPAGDTTIVAEVTAAKIDDTEELTPVLLDKVDEDKTEDAKAITIVVPATEGNVPVEIPVADVDETYVAVDENGNVLESYIGENGVVVSVSGSTTVTIESRPNGFIDTVTAFSKRVADYCAARGITYGTTPTTFSPEEEMTVGDTTRVINRITGASEEVKDTQVSNTRSGMIVELYKASGSPAVEADLSAFTDLGDATAEEIAALKWAVANKIIFGTTTTTMDLKAPARRDQFFTMVMRAIKLSVLTK